MFDALVIGGGSTKGVGFLGALHYIQQSADLTSLRLFIGCSVGSILCFLIALGYAPLELVPWFQRLHFPFEALVSKEDVQLFSFDHVLEIVRECCLLKTGAPAITFQDLYQQYQKELICVSYNYTQGRAEQLSYRSFPEMDCLDAIRLSCAIPLLFKECTYNDDIYVDGGLVNNFPLDVAVEHGGVHVLALNMDEELKRPEKKGILTKLNHLFFVPITLKARENIQRYQHQSTIINLRIASPFYRLHLKDEDVLSMLLQGYLEARAALQCTHADERGG